MIYLRNDDHLIPYNYEERIKKSQYYISFRNGVLDIRTLKLYKHIKDRLVFYELDAEWMETAAPMQFESFLQTASRENRDIRKRILETLGYLLAPINEGKYFFVMGTAPNSGKSTLGEILERFIGKSYVAHLSTEQVGGRFALGDIHGKTLNLSMDLPKGKLSAAVVSILKQITGGDTITTERKYDSLRDVHSNMRFLFASNYPVTISKADNDDAFWDRMIVVPFKYSLAKEDVDVHFVDKLVAEKDEIKPVRNPEREKPKWEDTITNRMLHWSYTPEQKEEVKKALAAGVPKATILTYFYPEVTVEKMSTYRKKQ